MSEFIQKESAIKTFFKKQWVREVLIFLAAFLFYQSSRALAIGDKETAFMHAYQVVDFEKWLGIFTEIPFQQWFLDRQGLLKGLNAFYIRAHLPITILFFVWLFNRRKEHYPLIRNVFLIGNFIAIFFFIGFPCAPPRMLNDLGFIDTLRDISKVDLYKGNLSKTFNQYAAVPSMHFGYSFLIGYVGFYLIPYYFVKVLAVLYPILVLTVIVATANHFWIDAILGGLIIASSYPIYLIWMKNFYKKPYTIPKLEFMSRKG